MKKFCGILVLAVVLQTVFGDVDSDLGAAPFVVGGTQARNGQFPGAVLLDLAFRDIHCGGTLVNDLHVVTAAHCLIDVRNDQHFVINPNWVRVIAGDINFNVATNNRVIRHASHIMIHEGYNPYSYENDIAIIRLEAPIQLPHNTIEPASRRTRIVNNNLQCVFAAWGFNGPAVTAVMNQVLTTIIVPILDRDTCNGINVYPNRVVESMLCGGVLAVSPTAAVCIGNTGSGLYCNGEFTGILSFGVTCGATLNRPGVYTQVRFFNQWIDQQFVRQGNWTAGPLELNF